MPPTSSAKQTSTKAENAMRDAVVCFGDAVVVEVVEADWGVSPDTAGTGASFRVRKIPTVASTISRPITITEARQPKLATPQASGSPATIAPRYPKALASVTMRTCLGPLPDLSTKFSKPM